jgi:hypothetical protein
MSSLKDILVSCAFLLICALFIMRNPLSQATGQGGCTAYTCPACFRNLTPLNGRGTATDGSGRRIINVFIDSNWNNPATGLTYVSIYNGTQLAIADWNAAQDTSCSTTTRTGYFLKLEQNSGQKDIHIKKDNTVTCGGQLPANTGRTPPDMILLNSIVKDLADSEVETLIAHELGHSLGLANGNQGGCSFASDIINTARPQSTAHPRGEPCRG